MLKLKKVLGSVLMILAVAVPMSVSMPVSADMITINSLYTDNCTSKLSISGGKASCTSVVDGFNNTTTKIVIVQRLQKKNSSGSWSNVQSWNSTINGHKAAVTKTTKDNVSKGTYRAMTSATVYSGNKSEVVTSYSSSVTVK